MQFIAHQSLVINGKGDYSREFTYLDSVIQMNELTITTVNQKALHAVYNTAVSDRITLNELVQNLKALLFNFDPKIQNIMFFKCQSEVAIFLIHPRINNTKIYGRFKGCCKMVLVQFEIN